MRAAGLFTLLLFSATTRLEAATTIDVSSTVVVPSVKRFGINLGEVNFWDTPLMKNLVFGNPGFEGLIYRSVVPCASGTATSCTDSVPGSVWPTGFWNGATYEFIWGTAKGRSGTVASSTAPSGGAGTTYTFADSGVVPAAGDYVVLRKRMPGGADTGWNPFVAGGGTVTTELLDLPPLTDGTQCIRLSALGAGQSAIITAALDTTGGGPFFRINGSYRLTFKAKGAGGANTLNVSFIRNSAPAVTFVNQSLVLTPVWSTYNIDFAGAEAGTAIGQLDLQLSPSGQSAVLLDDVSLTQTNGDPANTTAFCDAAVHALQRLRPAILRYLFDQYGDSPDNQIAPVFGRQRTGYRTRSTSNVYDLEYGLHEFLDLCALVGAEPRFIVSVTDSTQEMANLMEYLGGPSTSPYGARRAARGRTAPWTDAFAKIHLEFGNEAWDDFDWGGAAIPNPTAYGNRGGEMLGVARSSPYYVAGKYDLILGGQADGVWRNQAIHAASSNNDSFAVAPYLGMTIDAFSTNEQLFGPLFAEPEMAESTGYMRQNRDFLQASSRPIPLDIYEVNVDATLGAISQAALDSFTPSVGAGIAVADHMLMMLRDLGIRNQNLFCLTGYGIFRTDGKFDRVWGAMRDLGITNRVRPQFLALELANKALGGDLVQTTQSGDNPTWNQPLLNGVSYPNAHFIQSVAFSNAGTRSVVVFNLSRTTALDVVFTGANAPSGTVTLKTLTSASINDGNDNTQTVATATQTLPGFNPAVPATLPPYSMSLFQWQTCAPIPNCGPVAFFTLAPCRVVDTRNGPGTFGAPSLGAGTTRVFPIAGQCGVPAGATAVAANVTITGPTAPGDLQAWPAGGSLPGTSVINFSAGLTRANNALLGLSAAGEAAIRCNMSNGTTNLILDVVGYFR